MNTLTSRMKRMQTSVPDSVEAKKARSNHPGKASEGASTSSSMLFTECSPLIADKALSHLQR